MTKSSNLLIEKAPNTPALSLDRFAPLNWPVAAFFAAIHVGAVAALFMFTWEALLAALILYWVGVELGICLGYHRLLTHRGFKTPKWLEYVLAVCGALSLEGGPVYWVAVHRQHHAKADRVGDPHSPHDGFWWSQIAWIPRGGRRHDDIAALVHYAPDLVKDPVHVWLTRWQLLPSVVLGLTLYALGGWPMVFWGIFLRVVCGWHASWLVNSIAHRWGYRRFETRDNSTNVWWVALITFGEGWHNNHHAHPASARHGLAWYEIDLSWWCIRALQLVGLAKEIRTAKLPELVPLSQERLARINWGEASAIIFIHAGAAASLFVLPWRVLLVAAFLYCLAGGLGICVGYHRLLTHRSFKAPKWLEYILAVCGTLALEGGPIAWAATHRRHHTNADRAGDPHSPRDGFWWAQMAWIYTGVALHNDATTTARYAPDLAKDRFYCWLTRWHFLPTLVLSALLLAWGGWPMLMGGICLRVVCCWHATWLVNSAAHRWGYRRFSTRDDSRNCWWVALLTFGEGWHNNHHAHPTSARHGLAWYEIDLSWWFIRALAALRLAKDIRLSARTSHNSKTEAIWNS